MNATMTEGTRSNGSRLHLARPVRGRQSMPTTTKERRELERDRFITRDPDAQAQHRLDCFAADMEEQEIERLSRLTLEAVKENAFRAHREAEQKLVQAEQNAMKVKLAHQEAAFTTKHIVLGSALVTCGAGIDIERVMSGFETCRLTVKNLPPNAKPNEIADLFTQQGIDPKLIHVVGTTKVNGGEHLKATIITNAEQGRTISIGLDGIPFRDEKLSFEVADNVSANAMVEGSPRSLQVEAPSPAISWWTCTSMVAAYIAPAWFSNTSTPHPPVFEPTDFQFKFFSTIPKDQYYAQERQWHALAESWHGCHLRTNIAKNERVIIYISGDDRKAIGLLKVRVETLIAGEKLDAACWHRSFISANGRQYLAKISLDTGAYIRADWKIHTLRVYGDADVTNEATRLIVAEVRRLTLLEWTVPLKQQSVGYFVREGLTMLQGELGEDSVSLDLSSAPCTLTIRGGEDARHALTTVLDKSARAHQSSNIAVTLGEHAVCPICRDTASHPKRLACGHSYCTACIRHYLTSAPDTKIFPLVCMGNEAQCRVPIPIPIIQDSLPPQKFEHLVTIAVSTYINEHPQDFRYCKTPTCVQVYRCNSGEQQCPSCFAEVCSACHEEAHQGLTCAERALHNDPAEQERLNEHWAAENGARKCPTCRVWMQKIDGCNHMTCTCGSHVCWECMLAFPANEIYRHMNQQHGGIGIVVTAEVTPNATPRAFQAIQEQQAEQQRNIEAERRRRAVENERITLERVNEENRRLREAVRQQEIADTAVAAARTEVEKREQVLRYYESQLSEMERQAEVVRKRVNQQQGPRRRIGAFVDCSDSD